MGCLWLVGSLQIWVSFAESSLFYRALLQKRPIICRSLLIEATPYTMWERLSYLSVSDGPWICTGQDRLTNSGSQRLDGSDCCVTLRICALWVMPCMNMYRVRQTHELRIWKTRRFRLLRRICALWVMPCMNESCHSEWGVSHMDEHATYEWVMPYMNDSCHIWMSMPHMNDSCHTWVMPYSPFRGGRDSEWSSECTTKS